jgi:hypothetical protein
MTTFCSDERCSDHSPGTVRVYIYICRYNNNYYYSLIMNLWGIITEVVDDYIQICLLYITRHEKKYTGKWGRRRRRRRSRQLLDNHNRKRLFWILKYETSDQSQWRISFGREFWPTLRNTVEINIGFWYCMTIEYRRALSDGSSFTRCVSILL